MAVLRILLWGMKDRKNIHFVQRGKKTQAARKIAAPANKVWDPSPPSFGADIPLKQQRKP